MLTERLSPGEKRLIQLRIDPASTNHPLSYWDTQQNGWNTADGNYAIYVGNSSADIALTGNARISRPPRNP